MQRDYTRIKEAIKGTNKKLKIGDWLSTYRELLYDLMKMKTAICDATEELARLKRLCDATDGMTRANNMINHKRISKLEKKVYG